MDTKRIYDIFTEIMNESGKNAKEQILKKYEGDMEFREALTFLLNPFIVTGISTKKMKKKISNKTVAKIIDDVSDLNNLKDVMDYLKQNNSGKDVNILSINKFVDNFIDGNIQEFIRKFVTKDLKLGISEKTVNKVYGKGTIPSFAVMLAESFEKKHDKVEGKFYVTLKLDGNRCIAIKEDDIVKFYTRKGQPIEDMTELSEHFEPLPNGYVFDGELLLVNKDDLPSDELFRATQKVVRKDGEKKNLEFYMFDAVTISEFKDGKSKRTYEQRRNTLDTVFEPLTEESKLLHVLPIMYKGKDKSVIPTLMKYVEEKNFEGVMVNTASGLYQTKRTTDLLKVKTMKTADLLVMSIEKAIDGQFEGLMSRVNVEYKGTLCGVGSGFTLEQRKHFINNPDDIVGKIIEVKYFEESKDEKTGLPSLRFPIFKGIRHDKDIDDINYGE